MNVNAILDWVKLNVFIVIFIVLMIAAVIALPIVSSGMNAKVRKEVDARAKKDIELARLKTETPQGTGIINDAFLKVYEEMSKSLAGDAAAVQKAAIEHNRKGRGVIRADVLPKMPADQVDVLPKKFHEDLMAAYEKLLAEVKAGMPPPLESMRVEILRDRSQFITQDLKKDPTSENLEPDEMKRLQEKLSVTRISLYDDAARKVLLYCSLDQLYPPQYQQANQPSVGEMYTWQWQFWVTQDVLRALHEANKNDQSVVQAPVKQVLSLAVRGLPEVGNEKPGSGGSQGGGGGFGAGGGAAAPPTDGSADAGIAVGGAPVDPKIPVASDFTYSITGRKTNPLYDVIDVDLDLVVESARLPMVMNVLSKYNFMTVTDLRADAADPFAAAQQGFFYGGQAVATVHLKLETVWLRAWTKQFMPASIKKAMGIAADPAASADPNAAAPST